MELNFTFSLDDTNKILAALSKAPYDQVADLIGSIRAQAGPQLNPLDETVEENPSEED